MTFAANKSEERWLRLRDIGVSARGQIGPVKQMVRSGTLVPDTTIILRSTVRSIFGA
jgi:hypothetical protein